MSPDRSSSQWAWVRTGIWCLSKVPGLVLDLRLSRRLPILFGQQPVDGRCTHPDHRGANLLAHLQFPVPLQRDHHLDRTAPSCTKPAGSAAHGFPSSTVRIWWHLPYQPRRDTPALPWSALSYRTDSTRRRDNSPKYPQIVGLSQLSFLPVVCCAARTVAVWVEGGFASWGLVPRVRWQKCNSGSL